MFEIAFVFWPTVIYNIKFAILYIRYRIYILEILHFLMIPNIRYVLIIYIYICIYTIHICIYCICDVYISYFSDFVCSISYTYCLIYLCIYLRYIWDPGDPTGSPTSQLDRLRLARSFALPTVVAVLSCWGLCSFGRCLLWCTQAGGCGGD